MEALTKWVGQMPDDVVRDMPSLAPMLVVLGYDPRANPPDYGKPDALVLHNTYSIQANRKAWDAKERQVAAKREVIWRSWLQKYKASGNEKHDSDFTETRNDSTIGNRTNIINVLSSEEIH